MSVLGKQYAEAVRSICVVMQGHRGARDPLEVSVIAEKTGYPEEQVQECIDQDSTLQYLFQAIQPKRVLERA